MIEALERARALHGFDVWAYVLMPEHVHLLLLPAHGRPHVGPILNSIKQSVAKRAVAWMRANAPEHLRRMADEATDGKKVYRFWQRGAGYDRNLWSSQHIGEAIAYIHANPVERGLCASTLDWPWSSAREFERPGAGPMSLDTGSIPPLK